MWVSGTCSVRLVVELNDLKGQPKQSSDSMIQRHQLLDLLLECIDFFISLSQLIVLINFFQFSHLLEDSTISVTRNMNDPSLKTNKNPKNQHLTEKNPNQTTNQQTKLFILAFSVIKIFLHCP